ncbi:MAG: DUF4197 domain-containing protein [Actinomycetota bacterium]|nr:DUF4197 domain-containing protein [Actinomycetota bacterium]
MRKVFLLTFLAFVSLSTLAWAGWLEDVMKQAGVSLNSKPDPDDSTIAAGLQQALSIGAKNAVRGVSRKDGYFANLEIKILMPGKIRRVADVLVDIGFQKPVDDFVLSMNRAAEKAAPDALPIFADAIKQMTFADAKNILDGGDTAATEYFQRKTRDRLYNEFKPIISASMDRVGCTRSYKIMIGKYEAMPFMGKKSFDLDDYVTNKALDGLFYELGQEEKKIRTDPAARVTDLLRLVFGK